jgi:HKD family nuclease
MKSPKRWPLNGLFEDAILDAILEVRRLKNIYPSIYLTQKSVRRFMADLDFILQAVTTANHAEAIRTLLELSKPSKIVVSVAFARTTGLQAIEDSIKPLAEKTKFFVGIRNDITSIQAIKRLLALKLDLYAVDTGSRQVIFHPKLYLATNASNAIAIIGSANMTFSGLHNNIEVSTRMALDFAKNHSDKRFVDTIISAFDTMLAAHPKHVFKITGENHAIRLFEEGRLADETVVIAPTSGSSVKQGDRDDLTPMKLVRVNRLHQPKDKTLPVKVATPSKAALAKVVQVLAKPIKGTKYLVWESKPLSERDLSIPKGGNTNPTGSMGFKKGLYDNIDQRHYFYDEVFNDLEWTPNKPGSKTLRATAKFELVIKNISYGVFDLMLAHKTDTDSESYKQSNFMTQIHWGDAKALIGKKDLLDRNLYLYRKDSTPPEFMIEID